jgi:protein ImuB
MIRRILSVWLPRLASESALRRLGARLGDDMGPFAVVARRGAAEVLVCLSPAAGRAGLRRGQPLSEARALCPALLTRAEADLTPLRRSLVRWAGRYAPWVAADGADGLVLDITGSAHLMGGEGALAHDVVSRLAAMGFFARAGVAGTRGAAWAVARYGQRTEQRTGQGRGPVVVPPGDERAALDPLPMVALRLDADTCAGLARLGLTRVADLARAQRAALVRRFGPDLALRLDQALGLVAEPVSPAVEPAPLAVRLTLPEPIGLASDVMAGLDRLLDRLCTTLADRGLGARRLRLELTRTDHSRAEAEVALARPMRDAPAMAALFARAIDALDAGFGFDALRLSAPEAEPLGPVQTDGSRAGAAEDLADLLTRLGSRLGLEALLRFLPAESHIPERGFLVASAVHAAAPGLRDWPEGPPRPLTLFAPEPLEVGPAPDTRPPRRFRWRGRWLTALRTMGPERIAPEWWFDDPAWRSGLRDYWRVDTAEGPRLWLFHTPMAPAWAVQGDFA